MIHAPSTSPAALLEKKSPLRRYSLREAVEELLATEERPLQIGVGEDATVHVRSPAVGMFMDIDRLTNAQRRIFCTALERVLPGADVVDEDRLSRVASDLVASVRRHPIGHIPEHLQRLLGISANADSHDVFCALSGSLDPNARRLCLIAVREAINHMRPPALCDWRSDAKQEKTTA